MIATLARQSQLIAGAEELPVFSALVLGPWQEPFNGEPIT